MTHSPAPSSALPSPPTSPTSPRATTARVRIKSPKRPGPLGVVQPTHGVVQYECTSPPYLPNTVSADPDASASAGAGAERRAIAGKRRKPSIAYFTPSSPSPRDQQPQRSRTLTSAMDSPRDGEHMGRENVSRRSSLALGSRSSSTRESTSSLDGVGTRERTPLTLVEKHADLLHFIAQKERKCLELRDQLAAHEKELAGLKRKWERIVNRGHDALSNLPHNAGLSGVAFDGLKEGVRMIAAGFSDLGGVIQELESGDKPTPKRKSLIHEHDHASTGSRSSTQESAFALDDAPEGGDGVTRASSLDRAGSLNCRMHKRASRVLAEEPARPITVSSVQNEKPIKVDVGVSLALKSSPSSTSTTPRLPPALRSAHGSGPVPMTAGPILSWMDSMGKKLSGLQNGQTLSKGHKRASLLLTGVSSTITSALSPGPTATTPAPQPRSTTPRVRSATSPPSTSYPQPRSQSQPRPYPSYNAMADWLDDEEEEQQRASAGGVMIPDSAQQPPATAVVSVANARGEGTASTVSSFDDDDWNW